MKFTRPLPATTPKALTYGDGNFAIDFAKGSPSRVQNILVNAQWMILALALVLFVLAGPRLGIGGNGCGRASCCGRRRAAVSPVTMAEHPRDAR